MSGSLIELAQDGTDEARRQLFTQVSALVAANLEERTDRELAIFSEVILKLYDEVPEKDRADLAQKLANQDKAPNSVAKRAAQDTLRVASPVLKCCPSLTQNDLLELAATLGLQHLQSIARRKDLSHCVSDKLVERGDEPVHRILAGNLEIGLSRQSMNTLVRLAADNEHVRTAFAGRSDLPLPVCQALLPLVSEECKKHLQRLMDDTLSKAQQEQINRLKQLRKTLGDALKNSDMGLLSRDADRCGATADDMMILLLQDGRFDHSVNFLGITGRIAQKAIRNAVYDGKLDVVIRAAQKARLEPATFALFAKIRCDHLKLSGTQASEWTTTYVKRQAELAQNRDARGVEFQARRGSRRQAIASDL